MARLPRARPSTVSPPTSAAFTLLISEKRSGCVPVEHLGDLARARAEQRHPRQQRGHPRRVADVGEEFDDREGLRERLRVAAVAPLELRDLAERDFACSWSRLTAFVS